MAELEIKPTRGSRWRVVGVILAAVVISVTVILLLAGITKGFNFRRATIYTYLPDASGLTTQSDVRLSGLPVGKVSKIELSGLLDRQRTVRVDMKIGAQYLRLVPVDSITSISADTLVGPSFVSIKEGKSLSSVAAAASLESEPLNLAQDRADQVQAVRDRLNEIDKIVGDVSSPDSAVGRFIVGDTEYQNVLRKITAFDQALKSAVSTDNAAGQAFFSDKMYNGIRTPLAKADKTLTAIQNGEGQAGKLFTSDEQYNRFVAQLKSLHAALADVNAGKGSAAGLIQDESAHRKILTTLRSTNALLDSLTKGEGTTARLLRDPQLYESLNGSLRDTAALLKDFRENPKKYLRIKVF